MLTPRVQWMNSLLISCFGKWIDETRIKEDTELRLKMNNFLAGKSGQVFLVYCQKPYKINERGERIVEPNGIYQIYVNESNIKFLNYRQNPRIKKPCGLFCTYDTTWKGIYSNYALNSI